MKSLSEELLGIDLFGTSTPDTHYKSHAEVADALITSHNLKVKIAKKMAEEKKRKKEVKHRWLRWLIFWRKKK